VSGGGGGAGGGGGGGGGSPGDARAPAAALDLGTNTLLLLVAAPGDGPGAPPRVLADECRIVRIGQGVDATRRLAPAAVARTLGALGGYAETLRRLGVPRARVAAVATSALRDVADAGEFLGEAAALLGAPFEIISGDEEARLTWLAVARAFPAPGGAAAEGALRAVLDVGGGSTEVVLGCGARILERQSIDIGSVRLTERHVHEDPPAAAVPALRAAAREAFAPFATARPAEVVGVAGTVTTLAAVRDAVTPYQPERVHGQRLSRDRR
jgi:exopolyphosphatase/guanosine-5'-triphosphate,3'-diphosphate pyrophosphatase